MSAPARSSGAVVLVSVDEFRDALREDIAEAVAGVVPQRPAVLDRRGLGEALGVCVDVVDRLRREGAPELTVGDSPRFELDAVLAWLRGRAKK